MEAQFTVRDTLPNFANWVNAYGKTFYRRATGFWFVPYGYEDDPNGDGWIMDTHAPNGFVRFCIRAEGVELLDVKAATLTGSLAASEDAELNAYFAELVRAIRSKWAEETIQAKANAKPVKAGTEERVREFHYLRSQGLSVRKAREKTHCDPRTYYDRCKELLGEEPFWP